MAYIGNKKIVSQGIFTENAQLRALIDGTITDLVIPEGTTKIGSNAFSSRQKLKTITIPDSVTTIETMAFNYCQSLTRITIPKSVTEIKTSAFNYCNKCLEFDFSTHKQIPQLGISGLPKNTGMKILVPSALYEQWIKATNWSDLKDYIVPTTRKSVPDESKFSVYVNASTLKWVTGLTGTGIGKTELRSDGNVPYLRLYGDGSSDEACATVPNIEGKTTGKYLVFAYRLPTTNIETYTNIQVFATTGGADITGQGDMFYMTAEKDGEWHIGVIDIEEAIKSSPWVADGSNSCKFNPNSDGTYTISRLRLDWFNRVTSANSYIDVAYVGICDSLEKAISADPDYTGREFGVEYFANALGSSAVLNSHNGMDYVSISNVVPSNGEVRHYLYDGGEAMLLGTSHYIGVLYRNAPEQYCEFHANSSNNLTDSRWYSTQHIMYEQGSGWKFMIFSLPKLADTVCRKLRLDYFNKLTAGATKSIDVAFVKFFASTDEANAYYQTYKTKYSI